MQFILTVGWFTIVIVVGLFLWGVIDSLRTSIRSRLYDYRRTHLKGKKPKAECYCEYCTYFEKESYHCSYSTGFVDSDCFCWRAEPMSEEKYKWREENRAKEKEL